MTFVLSSSYPPSSRSFSQNHWPLQTMGVCDALVTYPECSIPHPNNIYKQDFWDIAWIATTPLRSPLRVIGSRVCPCGDVPGTRLHRPHALTALFRHTWSSLGPSACIQNSMQPTAQNPQQFHSRRFPSFKHHKENSRVSWDLLVFLRSSIGTGTLVKKRGTISGAVNWGCQPGNGVHLTH